MAKTQTKRMVGQGKALAAKATAKAGRAGRRVQVTLGDLIAAAFDVAGGEAGVLAAHGGADGPADRLRGLMSSRAPDARRVAARMQGRSEPLDRPSLS